MTFGNALLVLLPLLTLAALVYFLVRFLIRQGRKQGPK